MDIRRIHCTGTLLMVVSASDARRASLLRWAAVFAAWAALWHAACRYEWGAVYFVGTAILFIFTLGLGKNTRRADGFSAWSVFNKGHERLLGTTTAQQFENEIMRRPVDAENRRWDGDGRALGGGGGNDGGGGGGGDALADLLGEEEAQEEREMQEAIRRSMLHTHGAEAPAPRAAAAGGNPKKAGKRARKDKRARKQAAAAAADAARRERLAAAAERRWQE